MTTNISFLAFAAATCVALTAPEQALADRNPYLAAGLVNGPFVVAGTILTMFVVGDYDPPSVELAGVVALGAIGPAAGHIYADSAGNGVAFFVARGGIVGCALIAWLGTAITQGFRGGRDRGVVGDAILVVGLLAVQVWSTIDAVNATRRYNESHKYGQPQTGNDALRNRNAWFVPLLQGGF